MLVRDRQSDRAAAGADVEDARLLGSGQQREAALDDDLRLRPRNEDARIHAKREPPKPPLPEHVGERLATSTAIEQ